MSPEYVSTADLETGMLILVRAALEEMSWDIHVVSQTGFAFKVNGTGGADEKPLIELKEITKMNDGQRKDARRRDSCWNVVLPMQGRSHHSRFPTFVRN